MPKLVRSASLTHYADIARASGLDPYRMLAEVGLPADSLSEVDLRIPAEKVARLLELSAQRSGVEAFGLRMAETRRASNLGPLALAVRDEPTLRHALNAAARYSHLQNEALFISIEEEANVAIIREELLAGEGVPVRQGAELALAVMFRLLRFFLGDEWHPKAVCFTHGAPAERTVHTRVFGPNVGFGQAFTGIVCDVKDLELPLPSADPVMVRYVHRYLGDVVNAGDLPLADEEDTTFSSILDAVRGELVLRYLERRERPFAEISGLLGFSEPSAFTRWFRSRFGCSPSQFNASGQSPRARPGRKPATSASAKRKDTGH
jgi:hypothetical protein